MGGLLNQILARKAEYHQQQNLLNYQAELEANKALSKQYFDMANNAEPELAPDLMKAGYAYGTAKIGDAKKLNKQFNLQDLLLKHSQAKYAPQNLEQPPQAPPQVGHTPPVQLHPDMPELGTVDESMINAHNGVQDQIQQQIKQANDQLAQQRVQAQAPPPVSGLPSPGFSSVQPNASQMPAPPGAIGFPTLPGQPGGTTGLAGDVSFQGVPELGGRNKQVLGNGMYSAVRTAAERARDAASAEGLKYNAMYGAQQTSKENEAAFNKQLEKQAVAERISNLKSEIDPATGKSIWDGLDANERANVEIEAKRIIPPRPSTSVIPGGPQFKDIGGQLFESPPTGSAPGTPWIKVAGGEKATSERNVPVDQQAFQGFLDRAGGDPVKAFAAFETAKKKAQGPSATEIASGERRSEAQQVADAIVRGEQPPTLTGMYRLGGDVRAELGKKGYNLAQAQLDWDATKRWIGTQNSASQLRLRQAAEFSFESLDLIDQLNNDLSSKMPRSDKFPIFNRAALAAAKGGALGPAAQQAATNLESQITDLQSELATVFKGGNSPTDQGLKKAQDLLRSDWTKDQLKAATDLARRNLRVRLNSIRNTGVVGDTSDNTYNQGRTGMPPVPTTGGGNPNPNGYVQGHIYGGMTYIGGDPNQQSSWRK